MSAQNQALADLEKTEFTMQEFSKARTTALEDNINSLFKNVRSRCSTSRSTAVRWRHAWRRWTEVPYPDLNTAGKINAGLDIINALTREYEITAPIFIDNAESVNSILVLPNRR